MTETARARVRARSVAAMLGVTPRTVANLAVSGTLPSAAKVGKVWTFDPAAIEDFIARQEERTRDGAWASRTSSDEAQSGGFERPSKASRSGKAFERGISRLLGASETAASRKSRGKPTGARR